MIIKRQRKFHKTYTQVQVYYCGIGCTTPLLSTGPFIEDCIRYTWLMQMQDPPVYIEWEFSRDSTIDTNILRSYSRADSP
jgi:hypothetical protein